MGSNHMGECQLDVHDVCLSGSSAILPNLSYSPRLDGSEYVLGDSSSSYLPSLHALFSHGIDSVDQLDIILIPCPDKRDPKQ